MVGTATANPLAGLIYVFGTVFMVSKVLKITIYWENLIKPALAWIFLIASYLFTLMIFNNSIFAGIVGTAVYAFICWAKVLSIDDKNLIREMRGKK